MFQKRCFQRTGRRFFKSRPFPSEVINLVMAGKSNDNDKSFGDTKIRHRSSAYLGAPVMNVVYRRLKSSSVTYSGKRFFFRSHRSHKPTTLRILIPPMETPDPPNDTPGTLKQVVLTPHDIPWSLGAVK